MATITSLTLTTLVMTTNARIEIKSRYSKKYNSTENKMKKNKKQINNKKLLFCGSFIFLNENICIRNKID